jgi:hypothetical protein
VRAYGPVVDDRVDEGDGGVGVGLPTAPGVAPPAPSPPVDAVAAVAAFLDDLVDEDAGDDPAGGDPATEA